MAHEARARVRLSRGERRAQLVRLGVELVSASSFDAVSIDRVADEAGISRSLLFHYFPTKRDFHVAVAEAGAEELLRATDTDPSLPPRARLHSALSAFVGYVADRRTAYLSIVRGATGGDPALREVFERVYRTMTDRVLDGLGATAPSILLRVAVRGWVAMVEQAAVEWLTLGQPSQEELVAMLEETLLATVTAIDPALAAAAARGPTEPS